MPARGYEFYPQAGILFIIHTPMARCCDALFLLAETEVAMKTVITSQVKKNIVFSLDTKFSSVEKSWCFIGVYLIYIHFLKFALNGSGGRV